MHIQNRSPNHVAVIMDGNRRWAKERGFPGIFGHASGARRVKQLVKASANHGIKYLTLFAFSTENWKRTDEEVVGLTDLLAAYLQNEVGDMNNQGVRLKIIGDISKFSGRIQSLVQTAQEQTAHNEKITLSIAINYGGRWDLLQAVSALCRKGHNPAIEDLTEEMLLPHLAMSYAPDPDLLIRTGGERRISNFILWQLSYTELYFTDVLWPAFDEVELTKAIECFASRERRFGGGPLAQTDRVSLRNDKQAQTAL